MPVVGLNEGENQFVAPSCDGQTFVPSGLGILVRQLDRATIRRRCRWPT